MNFPLVFDGKRDYSGWGIGLGGEVGYDLCGWLFGLRYVHLSYGPGGMIHGFSHNMLTVEIAKIFTKYHIPFFPRWLDFRLKFGFGVDFSGGRYYKSEAMKSARLTSEEHFQTLMISPGAFFEFSGFEHITPYLGANFDFTPDINGTFFMPTISLGLRTTLERAKSAVKKPETKQEPEAEILPPVFVEETQEEMPEVEEEIQIEEPVETEEEIILGGIVFDADAATFSGLSAVQKQSNAQAFKAILKALEKFPDKKVTIQGYANSISRTKSKEADLLSLSEERAKVVMEILILNGIEEDRLNAVGMGGANPIETEKENAWKNRRVEFVIEGLKSALK